MYIHTESNAYEPIMHKHRWAQNYVYDIYTKHLPFLLWLPPSAYLEVVAHHRMHFVLGVAHSSRDDPLALTPDATVF